jgi:hypothetical protein
MINPSDSIIWFVNFLTKPAWRLVLLYVIILLIVAWTRYDNWIAKGKS